ncbi:hypothetical protein Glove_110g78 [Diversispora epigaea]|uniref:Potassium channel tetramerisation-type BTB domain-containing protein n=1 Tax=Diversispora epigaea TaxID=1348612 RepID=A0A397JBW3_9GLOM|nr:hypothetical protein Glove_110g78 [Diversispora epigaea]
MPKNSDEHIVLNVGGIKYTTTRSTLASQPNTMLANMFNERNQDMLKCTNQNEYFFDRNGRAFYYVLELYRNNRVIWPRADHKKNIHVSRQELIAEFEYFGVPWQDHIQTCTVDLASGEANTLDDFIEALEEAIPIWVSEAALQFKILFTEYGEVSHKLDRIKNVLLPFKNCGFHLLVKFKTDLINYLNSKFPGLVFQIEKDSYHSDKYYILVSESQQFLERIKSHSVHLNSKNLFIDE